MTGFYILTNVKSLNWLPCENQSRTYTIILEKINCNFDSRAQVSKCVTLYMEQDDKHILWSPERVNRIGKINNNISLLASKLV